MNVTSFSGAPSPANKILVVAESQSSPQSWAATRGEERDESVAILQHQGETDRDFARRTAARIQRLCSTGFEPRRAIFALRSGSSDRTSQARSQLARALVAALCLGSGVELVLAGNRFDDASRHDVFALVETLTAGLAGTAINVKVQFAGPGEPVPVALSA